jgi:type I restriction enzyme S subunit
MAGEWPKIPLDQLTDPDTPITYGVVKPGPKDPNGVKFIRGGDIADGRVLAKQLRTITREVSAQYERTLLHGGEIVVSLVGNPGQVAIVPPELRHANIARQVGLVRLRPDVDTRFVKYFLLSSQGQAALGAHSRGSVQQVINLRDLKTVLVPIPPLPEQQAIACVLGALDDKIELNRRMNETLEAMARAVFKSWFVDFDPVRAKAAGQQPPGLAPHIAELFPDAFEESELGEIPKGWDVTPLSEIVELISGGTPKRSESSYWDGDIPWFSVRDVPTESDVFVLCTQEHITQAGVDNSAARVLPEGTTIITARGTVGKVALTGVPMAMNQSCYGVRGRDGYGYCFNYYNLRRMVATLQQRTHGSVFDTITRDTFNTVLVVAPPIALAHAYDEIVSPVLERIKSNGFATLILATLRDTLLPRLISGELRLLDAERIIGRLDI